VFGLSEHNLLLGHNNPCLLSASPNLSTVTTRTGLRDRDFGGEDPPPCEARKASKNARAAECTRSRLESAMKVNHGSCPVFRAYFYPTNRRIDDATTSERGIAEVAKGVRRTIEHA
jgi:hypothetical protein